MPRNPKSIKKKKNKPQILDGASAVAEKAEPYPDFPWPSPEQCRAARDGLLSLHGFPEEFSKFRRDVKDEKDSEETVLDGLVSTLLSQNTTDANSCRSFKSLKSTFSSWDAVLEAEMRKVEDAIRCGGLAKIKAARIKSILKAIKDKRGDICLEYLRKLSIPEVKAELSQFKGIGPKTVACVLMFYLQEDDFPVDTHVFRITRSIGWIPLKADRGKAYLHLNRRIPDDLKFDLNCLLVTHGKRCERCGLKGGNKSTGKSRSLCPLASRCHGTE